jgi:non-specific serine/threonine protein kinase
MQDLVIIERTIENYLKKNATSVILDRGIRLWQSGHITQSWKTIKNSLQFKVLSSQLKSEYIVDIGFNGRNLQTSCTCPYDHGGICKHIAAALAMCKSENLLTSIYHKKRIDPGNVSFTAENLDENRIERSIASGLDNKVKKLINPENIKVTEDQNGIFRLIVHDGDTPHSVLFRKNKYETTIFTSCNCNDTEHILCAHKLGALLYLSRNYGEYAFELSHSWEEEKKALLEDYGYTPDNYPADKFQFYFNEGEIALEVLDPSVFKISELTNFESFQEDIPTEQELIQRSGRHDREDQSAPGYVVNLRTSVSTLNIFEIIPVHGLLRKDLTAHKHSVDPVEGLFHLKNFLADIDSADQQAISLIEKNKYMDSRLERELFEMADVNSMFYWGLEEEELQTAITELKPFSRDYLEYLREAFNLIKNKYTYITHYQSYSERIPAKNLQKVDILTDKFLECRIEVEKNDENIQILFSINLEGELAPLPVNEDYYPLWINIIDGKIYQWKNHHHFLLAAHFDFRDEYIVDIPKDQWPKVFSEFIQKIQRKIPVKMDESMKPKEITIKPTTKIKLSETGNFLLLYPIVAYGNSEVLLNEDGEYIYQDKDKELTVIPRDKEYEQKMRNFIVGLHSSFKPFSPQEYYFLHVDEVMKKMWFFDFFEKCQEQGIEIYGIKNLKKIRYNPNRPSTSFSVKSGIDWFDMDMEVNFGDQSVSLKDIRKAVMKDQQYVKLGNDSWGLLPDEWLDQWSGILKFGKVQNGKLKLSKLHFQLIDQLYNEIDNNGIAEEMEEKKKLLRSFDSIQDVEKPEEVKAELRNYQQAGLSWLVFLYRFQWGGILADDMGLGKTLQMLALFQFIRSQNGRKRQQFLVVAPTTLLFNWENEIQKFVPGMKYLIHWGMQRNRDSTEWNNYDIILTTYGTLTRDIEWIKDFRFTVAVLDESQAIKNPSSLRFKAVNLINAKYRYTLTGTPIENNTMELYAQMQFVNPGLLGSQNFFKKEYVIPIDKNGDKNKTRELQQLIKPFLLRRTKERVAKELPPKTEIPLYCEMGEEQKKVYEAFKNEYRNQVLNKIEEEGLEKAKFNVLDALTKLRQICDSPALMNTEEDYGEESVKLREIMRHLREKTGEHKVILFSQFVSMLKLITSELEEEGLVYSYLDGSTRDRKEAVKRFQENQHCRIMVISLKAGGLGLNLTEADYIYLIDPWWNPAVEQQAIDRTHRIGQDKHIFAYKMICKDTVEEKILNLQQHKKSLAEDLITAEQSFVKKLSEEDIRAIFD